MRKIDCNIYHDRQSELEKCMWCGRKLGLSFKEKLDMQIAEISLETKQKILDLMHEGKTLGEVCKITGLETIIVGNIIVKNINDVKFLRKENII